MNIKSLLLGSAAALAVVSGAQAADAVVAAEPEPMEYVRVCDAYGTGFFYIPGTETCLKVGGRIRYEKSWGDTKAAASTWKHSTNARATFEARNDSEFGTVYSFLILQANSSNNQGDTFSTGYYMGIGGLEFGKWDNQWAKFFGYGGRTDNGGTYSNQWDLDNVQYVSYTANFDGFAAMISLDNDADYATGLNTGNKYMPDVTAGVSGTFGDWSAAAGLGYDESDDSVAAKGVVRGDLGMFGVTLMGLYSNSATNTYFSYDGFSVIAGASASVTDTVSLAADVQYWDNNNWKVIGDVNWAVASGFSVLLEASINKAEDKTAMLRFQRSF